jgi:hypothetical protein
METETGARSSLKNAILTILRAVEFILLLLHGNVRRSEPTLNVESFRPLFRNIQHVRALIGSADF